MMTILLNGHDGDGQRAGGEALLGPSMMEMIWLGNDDDEDDDDKDSPRSALDGQGSGSGNKCGGGLVPLRNRAPWGAITGRNTAQ